LNKTIDIQLANQTVATKKLKGLMRSGLNSLYPTINKITGTLDNSIHDLDIISTQLNKTSNQLSKKQNEIEDRLKQIEFPFGKIPIGLDESIFLFPVGLAVGFLICASILGNTIRLRKDIHTRYKIKKDAGANSIADQKVDLIAPLWIDPISKKFYQLLKLMIFLVPLVMFVVSLYLISHIWGIINRDQLAGVFVNSSINNLLIHGGLYILSFGFFIYGCWRIFVELRNYKK
jgi:hypothetical protein